MARSNVLVTYFSPFDGRPVNTSQLLAERCREQLEASCTDRYSLHYLKLPVVWGASGALLQTAIQNTAPCGLFMLGEWNGEMFRLEKQATSRRRDQADETGQKAPPPNASGHFRDYTVEMDIDRIAKSAGHAKISTDAGGYLCEEAYYAAANLWDELRPGAAKNILFVHVPRALVLEEGKHNSPYKSDAVLFDIFRLFVAQL